MPRHVSLSHSGCKDYQSREGGSSFPRSLTPGGGGGGWGNPDRMFVIGRPIINGPLIKDLP